jgi:tetratricopeptide (TPR) repeat protein
MSRRDPSSRCVALLGAALAASALAACASPADRAGLRPTLQVARTAEPSTQARPEVRPSASLYGLFLAGQAALENGSSRDAAFYLGEVSERAPDAGFLKERAFTAALVAGDVTRAAALAPGPGEGTPATQRLGQLTEAVEFLATGRPGDARGLLAEAPTQGATGTSVVLLRAWAAAMAGDWEAATAPVAADNQLTRMFASLARAKLLERNGRHAEADAAYKQLTSQTQNGLFALSYGAFLERRGRRSDAVALYDRVLREGSEATVEYARARAVAGRSPPALATLREGAAEALLAPAAVQMARRQPEIALALLRLSLRLNPEQDEGWMLVGDAMTSAGDEEAAREAFGKIRPSSPEYSSAQSRLAWSLQREGDSEGALKLARATMDRTKDSAQSLSAYADLLRENSRFEESIAVMDKLVARGGDGPDAWRLYYLRGVAKERSGRWDKAEADLEKALSLNPDEPDVMNYLAFGWADRGHRLNEAIVLLEKAATLKPRSGEIRDSLGWARFRAGQYPEAVRDLERAVGLAPADPAVNDHLGDAYLQVGRRLEAEYQWRRVLTLQPEPALKEAVEVKLKRAAEPGAGAIAAAGAIQ